MRQQDEFHGHSPRPLDANRQFRIYVISYEFALGGEGSTGTEGQKNTEFLRRDSYIYINLGIFRIGCALIVNFRNQAFPDLRPGLLHAAAEVVVLFSDSRLFSFIEIVCSCTAVLISFLSRGVASQFYQAFDQFGISYADAAHNLGTY